MATDALLDAERVARAELRRAIDELEAVEVRAGLRRPSRVGWLMAVAAIVTVVVAAVGVTVWVRADAAYTDADYEQAAIAGVALLLSPDHRRPDQARRILDGSTGEFRDQFAQSADSYSRFVESQGTVARGTVDGAGVSGRSGDKATVLVAASVEFLQGSETAAGESVRQFRLRVLMQPDDGRLKMAAVQYLP